MYYYYYYYLVAACLLVWGVLRLWKYIWTLKLWVAEKLHSVSRVHWAWWPCAKSCPVEIYALWSWEMCSQNYPGVFSKEKTQVFMVNNMRKHLLGMDKRKGGSEKTLPGKDQHGPDFKKVRKDLMFSCQKLCVAWDIILAHSGWTGQ